MRLTLLAVPLLALGASADTSRRESSIDPRRFELIRKLTVARGSILSPAGGHLARYVGNDVELVELEKGTKVSLTGHVQNIHDGGWSRDGHILATSGYDGFVRVWDVTKERELASIAAHTGYA